MRSAKTSLTFALGLAELMANFLPSHKFAITLHACMATVGPHRGPPSAKKTVAGTDQFEAANGVTAAANGVTAATNCVTAGASGVTAAAVMSIQYWKNLRLPIQNAPSWFFQY